MGGREHIQVREGEGEGQTIISFHSEIIVFYSCTFEEMPERKIKIISHNARSRGVCSC